MQLFYLENNLPTKRKKCPDLGSKFGLKLESWPEHFSNQLENYNSYDLLFIYKINCFEINQV